jgi:hypothetical protein
MKSRRVVVRRTKSPEAVAEPSKPSVSACDDIQLLITKRAYELHAMRGYRDGSALDDWLEAEREILSQIPPVQSGG